MGAAEERKALARLSGAMRRIVTGAREAVRTRPPALPPGEEEPPQDRQETGRTPGGQG